MNRPALAEDRLHALVVVRGVVAEVRRPVLRPVVPEAGERARLLADVVLGVAAAVAEREELHHLAAVVLVRRVLRVVAPVEPEEHRRVGGHAEQEVVERAEALVPEEIVLLEHQPLRADAVVRGREPVVPDERHPLDERPGGADHPVEPPEVVVAPGVVRRERVSLLVVRRVPDELLATGIRQRVDGAVEPELGESLRLTGPRPEARAPEKPLGLRGPELPSPHCGTHHSKLSARDDGALIPFGGFEPREMDRIPANSNLGVASN